MLIFSDPWLYLLCGRGSGFCMVGVGEYAELTACDFYADDMAYPEYPDAGGGGGGALSASSSGDEPIRQYANVNLDGSNSPGSTILGWAGEETGWGKTSQSSSNQNYFNQKQGDNWFEATACKSKWECFPDFASSAVAALFSPFLDNYTYASGISVTHPSAGSILADQLSQGMSLAAAFQQVGSGSGPTGGWNAGESDYGTRVAETAASASKSLDCLKKNGYVH